VEEALRRAVSTEEGIRDNRARAQRAYLEHLPARADLEVLKSEEMWR
jgi:phosphodiesterase/alkaline phosphatase D-like protein